MGSGTWRSEVQIFPKVKIRMDECGFGEIEVDGVPISGVKRFAIECEPGSPPVVGLELIVEELTVETQAVLEPHIRRAIERKVLGR